MITGYIKGNIVELFMKHECDIAHGCNCFTTMGAGVAGQLAKAYPPILDIDIDEDRYYDNNLAKLGTHTRAIHKKGTAYCYNLYTQYAPGPNVDYGAIFNAFHELNSGRIVYNRPLYIPKIGAGIAGGDWELIEKLINLATPDIDIMVVEYEEAKC